VNLHDRALRVRERQRTLRGVGRRDHDRYHALVGERVLEQPVEVGRHDHAHVSAADKAADRAVRRCGDLQSLRALLVVRLKVAAQQTIALRRLACELFDQLRVVGFLAVLVAIPAHRIVADVVLAQFGHAPREVKHHLPSGRDSGRP
jgi:hypothetical protein